VHRQYRGYRCVLSFGEECECIPQGSQIRDVNLTLKNYSYNDSPDDADVLLVHREVNCTVISDVGGVSGISNITLVLDDEATFFLPDSGNLGDGGTFKPRNAGTPSDDFPSPAPTQNSASALSGFDNQNPNGPWGLFVRDDSRQACGKFGGV
jgi:hypothetical protein